MTAPVKKRLRRARAATRRNLALLSARRGKRAARETGARLTIKRSVAKNLEALEVLARE